VGFFPSVSPNFYPFSSERSDITVESFLIARIWSLCHAFLEGRSVEDVHFCLSPSPLPGFMRMQNFHPYWKKVIPPVRAFLFPLLLSKV